MQIGVSSYSYSRLVRSGQMKQIEVIAKPKKWALTSLNFPPSPCPKENSADAELKPKPTARIPIANTRSGLTSSLALMAT